VTEWKGHQTPCPVDLDGVHLLDHGATPGLVLLGLGEDGWLLHDLQMELSSYLTCGKATGDAASRMLSMVRYLSFTSSSLSAFKYSFAFGGGETNSGWAVESTLVRVEASVQQATSQVCLLRVC
jgi:hypothetical protein